MKIFTILAGAAALAAMLAVALARIPQPQTPVKATTEDRFDQAWNDTLKVTGGTVLRKADRERLATADPKPVQTERIELPPLSAVPAVSQKVSVEDEDTPRRKKSHKAERRAARGDICSRHGMRKVMVGRYKWRCRK